MAWGLWVKDQALKEVLSHLWEGSSKGSSKALTTPAVLLVMSDVAGARQPVICFYLPQRRELSEGRFSSVALWSRKRKSPRAEGQLLG